MFKIGDLIIYSTHGVCQIDDICDKTFNDSTAQYYVLHPVDEPKLSISIRTDNEAVMMLEIIQEDEALKVLDVFKQPGTEWIDKNNQRNQFFAQIIKNGDRNEISSVINTLMRRKADAEKKGKKLSAQDSRFLSTQQKVLFTELSLSLSVPFDDVLDKAIDYIGINTAHA